MGVQAFTPGGRQHAALSPIAQEEDEEEEEEETEGGRRSHRTSTAMAEQEDEEEDAPARGYLQPPVTSTPGKEYHVSPLRATGFAHLKEGAFTSMSEGEKKVAKKVSGQLHAEYGKRSVML